ncbi:MAG TPA: hypothetical protein VGE38_16515 [Nocardioides sp.]|uniref:hypothetical protein n=1 Tax=Nocardioides sp. TaxID=35761 RepID=UPI002ED934EE
MQDKPRPTRATVLHAVTKEILARQDGQLPTDLADIATFFTDEEDLLGAVLLRWHTLLTARLEHRVADEPDDRTRSVIDAWCDAANNYRGVLLLIDQLRANPPSPAVARAVRATAHHDWAALAVCAGLASAYDEPAIRVGQRLELKARRRCSEDQSRDNRSNRAGLKKLKAMLKGRAHRMTTPRTGGLEKQAHRGKGGPPSSHASG